MLNQPLLKNRLIMMQKISSDALMGLPAQDASASVLIIQEQTHHVARS
jgi:hypothetical protein